MLINCPRCGFQQPKDQYCAQCGVDINSFQPVRPSAMGTLFKNPLVQLSFALVAIAGVGLFVYQQNQSTQSDATYTFANSEIPVAQPSSASAGVATVASEPAVVAAETADVASTTANNENSGEANPEPSSARALVPTAASESTVPATVNASPTPQSKALVKSETPHLVVTYAEVDRNALNAMMNESRNTGQFMSLVEYSAGILPSTQRMLNSPGVTVLRKDDRSLETNRSFSWFLGIKSGADQSQEIGLTTFFELTDIEQGLLRGNLEILRSWREPGFGSEPQKKSFPAMFEITPENGFFMAGVLPPRSLLSNESELTEIDLYKILNSPRFKAEQSELVIFIQFQKSP